MKFKMLTDDGKDNDVLGGVVELDNVYIKTYGSLVRGKSPDQLDVGESCIKKYAMSGQKPTTYKIIRVE